MTAISGRGFAQQNARERIICTLLHKIIKRLFVRRLIIL